MDDPVLSRWNIELAVATRRPYMDILACGLQFRDFPEQEISIQYADGHCICFRNAFIVISGERNEMAIFSRRDGHFEFPCDTLAVRLTPMRRDRLQPGRLALAV